MKAYTSKTQSELYYFNIYNTAFFGGARDGCVSGVDGQIQIITDLKRFVVNKIGGYGGLTWFPEQENNDLLIQPNEYRFINDSIIKHINIDDFNLEDNDIIDGIWKEAKNKYTYSKIRLSYNVQLGDTVLNIQDNDKFVVNNNHDVGYINRNFFYKITSRKVKHPEPMKKEDFLNAYKQSKNPLLRWEIIDLLPKNKNMYHIKTLYINGLKWESYVDYTKNIYYVIGNDIVYTYRSSISAPYYDLIDYLTIKINAEYKDGIRTEYCLNEVRSSSEYDHFDLFTETESYHYNNRETYL